jgi:DNA-binding NarL/FixJ family response regulator
VLTLVAKGMSNRQIAVAIRKSIKTVETYRSRIKQKVGITSSTALAQFAVTTFTQLRPLRSTDAEAPAENQTDLP